MNELTINVVGAPAPQGSKRAFVVNGRAVMAESSKKVKPWRQDVKSAVEDLHEVVPALDQLPFTGPLEVVIDFYLPRPGYHFGTGRNAGVLKANAPTHVDKKPDADKLLRSTLDGLKEAGIYRDDAQVAIVTGRKYYANAATGARITVRPLNVSPADGASPVTAAGETPAEEVLFP
ncbi:MAG TPA: RusA family crossover junction endodeoxyribonuclease [Nocardioides sp.]|uniref:RusA family crossover junction endodeoxyribonuclease n=1 Tax=Nocardioides sp. TaxID=35761 RepID=UPI002EDA7706